MKKLTNAPASKPGIARTAITCPRKCKLICGGSGDVYVTVLSDEIAS